MLVFAADKVLLTYAIADVHSQSINAGSASLFVNRMRQKAHVCALMEDTVKGVEEAYAAKHPGGPAWDWSLRSNCYCKTCNEKGVGRSSMRAKWLYVEKLERVRPWYKPEEEGRVKEFVRDHWKSFYEPLQKLCSDTR